MRIVVYGLSITSSWGNGHATTYRSLLKALAQRGHSIHFVEKDLEWYRNNRDLEKPGFCDVRLYENWKTEEADLLTLTMDADVAVIGSYFPDAIEATLGLLARARCPILFYDIDTPITLSHLRRRGKIAYLDPSLIPHYAAYLSFTGGPVLRELEEQFGARRAVALYCAVDTDLYRPGDSASEYRCDLSYLGTYSEDRQGKLLSMLNQSAARLSDMSFIVAGSQYPEETCWQPNVRRISHLSPPHHASFYSSSRFSLNLTRLDMVATGYSPSVRLFEASACGSAIISDSWVGLGDFFTPGEEILLPQSEEEVVEILSQMPDSARRQIGLRARDRILAEHTARHRAFQFEEIVSACMS